LSEWSAIVARRFEISPGARSCGNEPEGKTFTGEELMQNGILPSCSKALEASVVELDSK
jgi:hypothetical protein